ncbi:MAG: hypothetical protein VKK80_17060 [Prochlorothrix sp.]|nr:hypothetical protein [Prochlorothrix sp.]
MTDPAAGSSPSLPTVPSSADPTAGDRRIQAVNEALIQFQETWAAQLQQDIEALQREKQALQGDVQHLRQEQSQLLRQASEQPLQQRWAKQFAQILAEHLQQQVQELVQTTQEAQPGRSGTAGDHNPYPPPIANPDLTPAALQQRTEAVNQLLIALDRSLTGTLNTLQQELSSCQHALKAQLTEMHGLERQGEAILETLVQRLSQQLAHHSTPLPPAPYTAPRSTPPPVSPPPPDAYDLEGPGVNAGLAAGSPVGPIPTEDYVLDLEKLVPAASPPRSTPSPRRSPPPPRWSVGGVVLALASVLGLALQYVFVEQLFQVTPEANGWGEAGAPLAATWSNTWLAVWLRMVVVLPVVIGLGQYFYPALWQDLQALRQGRLPGLSPLDHRRLTVNLLLGGGLLFFSQWLLYQSVGQAAAGSAVTLFFLYPAFLALLSWGLVGDRPSSFRLYCLIALGVGGIATLSVAQDVPSWEMGALLLALLSAGGFAFYLLLTSVVGRRLHYSVITVVQFGTVFLLSTPAMFVVPQLDPPQVQNLVQGGLWLGGAAAVSYAFNTFSVQAIGALPTALITALAPFLTVLLASLLLGDSIPWTLGFGTLAITLGSTFMNLESLKRQP